MTDDRPVNRCAFRGCPAIGHWPEGQRCPMHRSDEYAPPRKPNLTEQWEVDE